jgi:hypothetical protein
MIRILLWREQIDRSGDINAVTCAVLTDASKARTNAHPMQHCFGRTRRLRPRA